MSCSAFVEYKTQGSDELYAFVYRRLLIWSYGVWKSASVSPLPSAEATQLLPLASIGAGSAWSDINAVPADGFERAIVAMPGGWNPILSPPWFLAELWVWTDGGWCLQAQRRNW